MKKILFFVVVIFIATSCEKDTPSMPSKDAQEVTELVIPSDFDWKSISTVACDFSAQHLSKVSVAMSEGAEPFATFFVGEGAEPIELSIPRASRTLNIGYENSIGKLVTTTLPVSERIIFAVPADSRNYTETRATSANGIVNYPTSDIWGTLLFEDLWPGYGDYDFNDLVVNYILREYLRSDNKVEKMVIMLQIKAVGGSLPYEFYVAMPSVASNGISDIKTIICENAADPVVITSLQGAYTGGAATVEVQGLRVNKNRPQGSTYVNTQRGFELSTPELICVSFEILFSTPVPANYLTLDMFDFFVGRTDELGRRVEIHMGDYKPSAVAFMDYYAICKSSINTNKSERPYFSNTNLVWGLNVPYDIRHTYEGVDFLKAYPEFKNWAQSGGVLSQDWYLNGVDSELINSHK